MKKIFSWEEIVRTIKRIVINTIVLTASGFCRKHSHILYSRNRNATVLGHPVPRNAKAIWSISSSKWISLRGATYGWRGWLINNVRSIERSLGCCFSRAIFRKVGNIRFHNVRSKNARNAKNERTSGGIGYGCSSKGCQPHSSVTTDPRRRWFNLAG